MGLLHNSILDPPISISAIFSYTFQLSMISYFPRFSNKGSAPELIVWFMNNVYFITHHLYFNNLVNSLTIMS